MKIKPIVKDKITNISKKAVVFIAIGIIVTLIYSVYIGYMPSLVAGVRLINFAKTYFSSSSDIMVKEVIAKSTSDKSYVIFEKASYFKELFNTALKVSEVDQHEAQVKKNKKLNEGYKLVICEPTDIDIPVIGWVIKLFYPLVKECEVQVVNDSDHDFRIYDIELNDIDHDNKQEIIVHWLDFSGAVRGMYVTAVFSEINGSYSLNDFFPNANTFTDTHNVSNSEQATKGFYENVKLKLKINGITKVYNAPAYSTDDFYSFIGVKSSLEPILVSAIDLQDGKCHYCEQSWEVSSYKFIGKKFVIDSDRPNRIINKDKRWKIADVKGYTYIPLTGIPTYMLKPSWLHAKSSDNAQLKYLSRSVLMDLIK